MIAEMVREITQLSSEIIKKQKSQDQEIDDFLDFINDIKKSLKQINKEQLLLDKLLYEKTEKPDEIWAEIDELEKLFKIANRVIKLLRNSTIYSIIKDELKEVVYSLNLIKETYKDILYLFKHSKSNENTKINNRLSKLL